MSTISEITNMTLNVTNDSTVVDPTKIFGPQRDSLYIVIPITIIYSIIFITGLFGNIFTCLVIVRNKSMHTATNYYLFSLAVSDLLLLISGMPQEMYSIWSKWPYVFGNAFCLIRGLAAETSTNASVLTITLFTIERYLAICHPFVSHKMSKLSRASKHVLMLWVAAFSLALPQALQFGIRNHSGVIMCLQTRIIIEHSFEISTFFFFFAPMVLITVLYSLIGLKLKKTSMSKQVENPKLFERSLSCTHSHKMKRKPGQSTRRVVKMLVAVVVAFFLCWAPFHAQRLVAIYGTTENHMARSPILLKVYSFLTYSSGVFYYMSTCINPIFYHIMSNKFREAFKRTDVSFFHRSLAAAAHLTSLHVRPSLYAPDAVPHRKNTFRQWCGRNKSMEGKRCSYTAMGFVRHPTSTGTGSSGKFKTEPAQNQNKRTNGNVDTEKLNCDSCKKAAMANGRQKPEQSTKKETTQTTKDYSNDKIVTPVRSFVEFTNEECRALGYCPQMPASPDDTKTYLPEAK